jgi:hypothetical protein
MRRALLLILALALAAPGFAQEQKAPAPPDKAHAEELKAQKAQEKVRLREQQEMLAKIAAADKEIAEALARYGLQQVIVPGALGLAVNENGRTGVEDLGGGLTIRFQIRTVPRGK